jgi:hypothetical protein
MKKLKLTSKPLAALPVILAVLALGVAPSCSSTEEEDTQQSGGGEGDDLEDDIQDLPI